MWPVHMLSIMYVTCTCLLHALRFTPCLALKSPRTRLGNIEGAQPVWVR